MSVLSVSDSLAVAVTSKASHRQPVVLISIAIGQRREDTTYLAFRIRPEVDSTADDIIQRGIGPLV